MKVLIKTAADWCFSTVKLCLYDFDLCEDQVGAVLPKIDADIKLLEESSASSQSSIWKYYKKKKGVIERLKRGEKCYVACVGHEIVSYCWMAFGDVMVGEIQRLIKVDDDEAYLYDAFTDPNWRGNGLFPAILTEILRALRTNGYRRALIFALSDNIPSRKAIIKAGFRQFSSVIYLRLFGAHIKLTARGENPF